MFQALGEASEWEDTAYFQKKKIPGYLHSMCYCYILRNSDIFTDINLHFNTEKAQWRVIQKSVSHQMKVAQ